MCADLRKKRREIIFRKSLVKNKVISAPYHVAEEKLLTIFRHLWEGEELKMVTYIDWKPSTCLIIVQEKYSVSCSWLLIL